MGAGCCGKKPTRRVGRAAASFAWPSNRVFALQLVRAGSGTKNGAKADTVSPFARREARRAAASPREARNHYVAGATVAFPAGCDPVPLGTLTGQPLP